MCADESTHSFSSDETAENLQTNQRARRMENAQKFHSSFQCAMLWVKITHDSMWIRWILLSAKCVWCTKALVTIETMMVGNDKNALNTHKLCVWMVYLHAAIVRFSYDFCVIDTLIHPKWLVLFDARNAYNIVVCSLLCKKKREQSIDSYARFISFESSLQIMSFEGCIHRLLMICFSPATTAINIEYKSKSIICSFTLNRFFINALMLFSTSLQTNSLTLLFFISEQKNFSTKRFYSKMFKRKKKQHKESIWFQ